MDMLHQLRWMLDSVKIPVACAFQSDDDAPDDVDEVCLWLVVSEDAADWFDQLSEITDAPIFLADSIPDITDKLHYEQWRQSMAEKVAEALAKQARCADDSVSDAPPEPIDFRDIWVIAASLGGPEAVKQFLSSVSKDLPIAFVYGQHIEANFAEKLPDILNKHSDLEAYYAQNGRMLRRGTVAVFPSHQLTRVDVHGQLHVAETLTWQAPYTPNLNQMVENVAKHFQYRMGVIVFSGMCDDGADASIKLAQQGMPLWAQTPDDCICASMPEAVIESGFVSLTGDPEALAEALNARYAAAQIAD